MKVFLKSVDLLGSEKAFAAGADIKEMKTATYVESYLKNDTNLTDIGKLVKPVSNIFFSSFIATF
jgi:enoyl-CoA hydratase/carnithine racemase